MSPNTKGNLQSHYERLGLNTEETAEWKEEVENMVRDCIEFSRL